MSTPIGPGGGTGCVASGCIPVTLGPPSPVLTRTPTVHHQPHSTGTAVPPASTLPFTGAQALSVELSLALGLIAVGTGLRLLARR